MSAKHVAAFGYYERGNVGDEIFLQTLQNNPYNIRFEALNATAQKGRVTRLVLTVGEYVKQKTKLDTSVYYQGRFLPSKVRTKYIENTLQDFDSVLLGPGGFVWLSGFHPWLDGLYRALLKRKLPLYCYGLGVEPPETKNECGPLDIKVLQKWNELLALSETVYVRDNYSKDLLQTYSIHDHVLVVNDVAFAYPLPSPYKKQEKIVGINLRTKFANSDIFTNKQQMVDLIDFFVDQGYKILLIPFQERNGNGAENDLMILQDILQLTEHKSSVRILQNVSPCEILRRMGSLDFFIGTRYHSVLFALRYGITTCAIAYRPKVRSLMEEYYGLGEYVVKPDQVSMIKELFMDREKIRSKVVTKTPEIERTTKKQLDSFLHDLSRV